jgi:hypothetical protein
MQPLQTSSPAELACPAGCWPTFTMATCTSGTTWTRYLGYAARGPTARPCSEAGQLRPAAGSRGPMFTPLQTLVKSFEVTELPVRAAKFIARKQWVITGSDDMFIRVYNYNTLDKVKTFEAHTDYIRCDRTHGLAPCSLHSKTTASEECAMMQAVVLVLPGTGASPSRPRSPTS